MGRMYAVPITSISVSAQQDLWEVSATAGGSVVVHEVVIGQVSSTTSTELLIQLIRGDGAITIGSGGAVGLMNRLLKNDAAALSTCATNNTTVMVSGTGNIQTLRSDTFNILNGWQYVPTPETRITLLPSNHLVVRMGSPGATGLTFSGTLVFEEV